MLVSWELFQNSNFLDCLIQQPKAQTILLYCVKKTKVYYNMLFNSLLTLFYGLLNNDNK